jgi:chromate reductase
MSADVGTTTKLLGLSGSIRQESFNTAVLLSLAERLRGGANLIVHPLNEVPPYNQDCDEDLTPAAVRELRIAVGAADGLILCSPEYNYGMSGVLKNAIDWISRPAMKSTLKGKPVLIMSCSPSATGGARAHAQMREALCACLARVVVRPQVVIAYVKEKIQGGRVIDQATLALLAEAVNDLLQEITVATTIPR